MTSNNKKPAPKFNSSQRQEDNGLWAAWALLGLAIAAVITLVVVALTSAPNTMSIQNPGASSATPGNKKTEVSLTVNDSSVSPSVVRASSGNRVVLRISNSTASSIQIEMDGKFSEPIQGGATGTFDIGVVRQNLTGWVVSNSERDRKRAISVTTDNGAGVDNGSSMGDLSDLLQNPGDDFKATDAKLQTAGNDTTHRVEMKITSEEVEIAPGLRQAQYVINGSSPGPLLHGKPGDTFEITVKNQTESAADIAFHGVKEADQGPIQPGGTQTRTLKFDKPGMWLYHSNPAENTGALISSLVGAVVIDPKDAGQMSAEYGFIGSEIYLGDGTPSLISNDMIRRSSDLAAFNGIPNQYDYRPIVVKQGERIRVWVANAGPDRSISFTVHGTTFDAVYQDGKSSNGDGVNTLFLAPGQSGFVELSFDQPGNYEFENHQQTLSYRGQHGTFQVK